MNLSLAVSVIQEVLQGCMKVINMQGRNILFLVVIELDCVHLFPAFGFNHKTFLVTSIILRLLKIALFIVFYLLTRLLLLVWILTKFAGHTA